MSHSESLSKGKLNKKILALLFTGVLMGALDIAIIGPALPAIKSEFGISTKEASWFINLYLLANMLSAPLMSKLSDTYGRRIIYIIDVALFAVGSSMIAISNDFTLILVGRAVQGFGSGGIFPVASAVIGDKFPIEKQGSALGMIGAVFGVAFILGPIIGGLLLMYNWQLIFAVNIPIAIVIIYYSNKLLPNIIKKTSTKFDALGTFLLISSLACLSIGISNLKSSNFLEAVISLKVLPFLIYPIVALPIFYKVEHRAENALIKPELMHNLALRITFFIGLCAGFAEAAVIFVPSMLKQTFGVTESTASFMLMPLVFAMLIGALAAGKSTDKYGPRATLIIAGILLTIGFVIVGVVGECLLWLYTGGALIGISLAALLGAPLRYLVNRNTERGVRASGQGLITISTGTGQIISAALLGALITNFGNDTESYKLSFLVISIVGVFALILATQLPKK